MDISSIVGFIKLHWDEILLAYTSAVTLASIIVKFTPTVKDDNALKAILQFLGRWIALDSNKGAKPSPND